MTIEMTLPEAELLLALLTDAEGAFAVANPPLVEALGDLRPWRSALMRVYLRERIGSPPADDAIDPHLPARGTDSRPRATDLSSPAFSVTGEGPSLRASHDALLSGLVLDHAPERQIAMHVTGSVHPSLSLGMVAVRCERRGEQLIPLTLSIPETPIVVRGQRPYSDDDAA